MAGLDQSREHTDHVVVEHAVVAVLADVQLISVGDDQRVDVAGLVGVDQIGIVFRNGLNLDEGFQTLVPVVLHVLVVLGPAALGGKHFVFGVGIGAAEAVGAHAVFTHHGLTRFDRSGGGIRVQRDQISADTRQPLDFIGGVCGGHAGICDLITVSIHIDLVREGFDLVLQAVLGVLTDKAGQVAFCVVPLRGFGGKLIDTEGDQLVAVVAELIGTVHPEDGRILSNRSGCRAGKSVCSYSN